MEVGHRMLTTTRDASRHEPRGMRRRKVAAPGPVRKATASCTRDALLKIAAKAGWMGVCGTACNNSIRIVNLLRLLKHRPGSSSARPVPPPGQRVHPPLVGPVGPRVG